jgi:hypothetical protein
VSGIELHPNISTYRLFKSKYLHFHIQIVAVESAVADLVSVLLDGDLNTNVAEPDMLHDSDYRRRVVQIRHVTKHNVCMIECKW